MVAATAAALAVAAAAEAVVAGVCNPLTVHPLPVQAARRQAAARTRGKARQMGQNRAQTERRDR